MKKVLITIIMGLAFLMYNVYGQVDDIKEKARKDKHNDRSSGSGDYSYDDDDDSFGDELSDEMCGCFFDIFMFITWQAISEAQHAALEQKTEYPYISSLETKVMGGISSDQETFFISPGLQGNWGIFSTDFRYTYLDDNTGTLNSLDWQILKLNVPVKTFKASAGVGFTYLTDPAVSYFEYTFGSELHVFRDKMVVSGEYRGTSVNDNNEVFRREVNFQIDYLTNSFGKFHLSPMAGFRFQEYHESIDYWMVNIGVAMRFH